MQNFSQIGEVPWPRHFNITRILQSTTLIYLVDPAKIVNLKNEHEVAAQQSVSLDCQAEGNPVPTYTWTPCDPRQSVCQKSVLHFQARDQSVYAFTCKVENNLGSDKKNTFICKLVKTKLLANGFPF